MSQRLARVPQPLAARDDSRGVGPRPAPPGSGDGLRLHPDDIAQIADAVASSVIDALVAPAQPTKLVDAKTLATLLGVSRDLIYERAEELGAVRLGDGPRARLRFDPGVARAALTYRSGGARATADREPASEPKAPSRSSSSPGKELDNLPVRELQTKRGGSRCSDSAPGAEAVTSTRQQATAAQRRSAARARGTSPRRLPVSDKQEVPDAQ